MSRNFAQIVFYLFALVIVLVSRKQIVNILVRKIGRRQFALRVRGGANRYLFVTAKDALAPGLYYLNLTNYALLALVGVLHLLIGWFSFAALLMKVLSSLLLLTAGLQAYLLAIVGNMIQFGQPFFLYRPDSDTNHLRPFASSVLDAFVYLVVPIGLIVCNFTLK